MSARIINGSPIADKINNGLKKKIAALRKRHNRKLKLVSLQVGQNSAIESYLKSQSKTAADLGIELEIIALEESADSKKLLDKIEELNHDRSVSAVILQRPLALKIDKEEKRKRLAFEQHIACGKDAEGLHLKNLGRLFYERDSGKNFCGSIAPCTAQAVMEIIASTGIELYGKEAVVIGHSNIIGKPLALMLLNSYVTTTVCHIATKDIKSHVKKADILISAAGKPGLIRGSWIKNGAVVVDVGTSRVDGRLKGDVEFAEARKNALCITPVPGGVGPLTTAMLMKNVVKLFIESHGKENI